jgi:hypothetical protein
MVALRPLHHRLRRRSPSPAREGAGEEFTKILPREAGEGDRRAASAVVEGAHGGHPASDRLT